MPNARNLVCRSCSRPTANRAGICSTCLHPVHAAPAIVPELRVCNCANCERELVGHGQDELYHALRMLKGGPPLPLRVDGTVDGRPYCAACLSAVGKPDPAPVVAPEKPWTPRNLKGESQRKKLRLAASRERKKGWLTMEQMREESRDG